MRFVSWKYKQVFSLFSLISCVFFFFFCISIFLFIFCFEFHLATFRRYFDRTFLFIYLFVTLNWLWNTLSNKIGHEMCYNKMRAHKKMVSYDFEFRYFKLKTKSSFLLFFLSPLGRYKTNPLRDTKCLQKLFWYHSSVHDFNKVLYNDFGAQKIEKEKWGRNSILKFNLFHSFLFHSRHWKHITPSQSCM